MRQLAATHSKETQHQLPQVAVARVPSASTSMCCVGEVKQFSLDWIIAGTECVGDELRP